MILLTGGFGFLGASLSFYLANRGEKIMVTDTRVDHIPGFLQPLVGKTIQIERCDVLDTSGLFYLLRNNPVKSIIHMAAIHEGKGYLNECLRLNVDGTINVLEACRIMDIERLTFISSQSVYHRTLERVHREDEDFPLESHSFISLTKKAGEMICDYYRKKFGLNITTVRPSQLYGPLYSSGLFPLQRMIENAIDNQPINLPDVDPESGDTLTYVKDCARAVGLAHLAKTPKYRVYNIGVEFVTYGQMAEVTKQFLPHAQITLGSADKDNKREPIHLNMDRFREEFGFAPEFDFETGVKEYIQWLQDGKY
ncbi:MAG: NAD(P)-dependent oxidoreductase [Deltaproteobacteria bacterium]|nr:NAD(P)-dependent oxidoreductase [Deltaproteobacteria bacterium]